MVDSFQSLCVIKDVLIMHLLRQQIEADLQRLSAAHLHLSSCLLPRLQSIHAELLNRITQHKRRLRQSRVRIVNQQKNSLDFEIAYVEHGYLVQHCFLLATLYAEAQILFSTLLEGGTG